MIHYQIFFSNKESLNKNPFENNLKYLFQLQKSHSRQNFKKEFIQRKNIFKDFKSLQNLKSFQKKFQINSKLSQSFQSIEKKIFKKFQKLFSQHFEKKTFQGISKKREERE